MATKLTDAELKVGDRVRIMPGQYLGRTPSKLPIIATIVHIYSWSYLGGITSLDVKCKPHSQPFMVNLKHSNVEVLHGKYRAGEMQELR